jgi:hypothetical protein
MIALRAPGGPGISGPRSTLFPGTKASQRIFHWPPLHPDIRTSSRASPRHPSRFLFPSQGPNGQWGPDQSRHKDARRTETAGPRLGQHRKATARARTALARTQAPPVSGPAARSARPAASRLGQTHDAICASPSWAATATSTPALHKPHPLPGPSLGGCACLVSVRRLRVRAHSRSTASWSDTQRSHQRLGTRSRQRNRGMAFLPLSAAQELRADCHLDGT